MHLLQAIKAVKLTFGSYQESMTEYEKAKTNYREWEETSKQIQTLDQQYRSILRVVQEYARSGESMQTCPACGRNGITTEHLLAHTVAEQEKLNPRLPRVEEAVNEALQVMEICRRTMEELIQQFREKVTDLQKLIELVEQVAEEKRKEAHQIQAHVSQLRKEMDDEDVFCQLYKE